MLRLALCILPICAICTEQNYIHQIRLAKFECDGVEFRLLECQGMLNSIFDRLPINCFSSDTMLGKYAKAGTLHYQFQQIQSRLDAYSHALKKFSSLAAKLKLSDYHLGQVCRIERGLAEIRVTLAKSRVWLHEKAPRSTLNLAHLINDGIEYKALQKGASKRRQPGINSKILVRCLLKHCQQFSGQLYILTAQANGMVHKLIERLERLWFHVDSDHSWYIWYMDGYQNLCLVVQELGGMATDMIVTMSGDFATLSSEERMNLSCKLLAMEGKLQKLTGLLAAHDTNMTMQEELQNLVTDDEWS